MIEVRSWPVCSECRSCQPSRDSSGGISGTPFSGLEVGVGDNFLPNSGRPTQPGARRRTWTGLHGRGVPEVGVVPGQVQVCELLAFPALGVVAPYRRTASMLGEQVTGARRIRWGLLLLIGPPTPSDRFIPAPRGLWFQRAFDAGFVRSIPARAGPADDGTCANSSMGFIPARVGPAHRIPEAPAREELLTPGCCNRVLCRLQFVFGGSRMFAESMDGGFEERRDGDRRPG